MKKRETVNLTLHVTVGAALAAAVAWDSWFIILATFIYAWLREQAQHRYILRLWELTPSTGLRVYRVDDSTFFGWVTWHRMWEVFQWVIGAAIGAAVIKLFG